MLLIGCYLIRRLKLKLCNKPITLREYSQVKSGFFAVTVTSRTGSCCDSVFVSFKLPVIKLYYIRCFVACRKHFAAKQLFGKFPYDTVDFATTEWETLTDDVADALNEFSCIQAYLVSFRSGKTTR